MNIPPRNSIAPFPYGIRNTVLLLILNALLLGIPVYGELHPTAVLVSEALQSKPYGDLLSVELSNRGVKLVERSELDRIISEQELSAFGGDAAASRIRIGQLLGARYLALLDRHQARGGQVDAVRLQVIDVAIGLRLGSELVSVDSQEAARASAHSLADAVIEVLARFPEGVESVVAVTPWLSENLTREYDALQTVLAELLGTTLQRQKGLAVVEIDEARRVARERALGGVDTVWHPAPWVVEGHFELQPVEPEQPRNMNLSATVRRMGVDGDPHLWRQNDVPVEQVGSTVINEVASAVLRAMSEKLVDQPIEAGSTFEALVERADRFSTFGMWEEAASLREAAIVSAPDHNHATAQRLAAAWEYARLLENGFMPDMADPKDQPALDAWTASFMHSLELWKRALWHVEYLILHRRIDGISVYAITDELLSIPRRSRDIREGTARVLIAADGEQKRFLLKVLPYSFDLPVPTEGVRQTNFVHRLMALALDSAVEPYYGHMTRTDLELFATLLTTKLPADLPPKGQFVQFRLSQRLDRLPDVHYSSFDGPDVEPPVTAGQWEATMRFLASQSKEERPAARALGEYALLAQERWRVDRHDQELRQALYKRALELEAEWRNPPKRGFKSDDGLASAIEELRKQLKPRSPSTAARHPTPHEESPMPDILDWLEPVNLRLMNEDKTLTAPPDRWFEVLFDVLPVVGGQGGLLNIWVGGNSVHYEREVGALELKIKIPKNHGVTSARWDGRYAWIADPRAGITLLDSAGDQVAMFDMQAGLPEGTWKILVQPLAEGRAIVAGTQRPDYRSWIAELWLDEQGRPRVKVIHAAIKHSGREDLRERQADPEGVGSYEWTWLWDRGESGRYLIVGRSNGWWPLAVDLATHRVTAIGQSPLHRIVVNPFWGRDQRWHSLHTVNDTEGSPTNLLLGAGTYGVALYEVGEEPVGPNLTFKQIDQWCTRDSLNMGNIQDGRLIPQPDGSVLFTGYGGGGWGRIRVDFSGPEPRLIGQPLSPARFPKVYGGSTAPAAGHGIVVWDLRGSQEVVGKVLRLKLPQSPEAGPLSRSDLDAEDMK